MSDILEQFITVANKPYEAAKTWKEEHNKLVMGIIPMHFPEELIHAAGILPITVRSGDAPVTLGEARVFYNVCRFMRRTIDIAAKGQFDFLDGMVFPSTCL